MDITIITGTHVARATRMRERSAMSPFATTSESASGESKVGLVPTEKNVETPEAPELDKYDISTLACTD